MQKALLDRFEKSAISESTAFVVCDQDLTIIAINPKARDYFTEVTLNEKNSILEIANHYQSLCREIKKVAQDQLSREFIEYDSAGRIFAKCKITAVGKFIVIEINEIKAELEKSQMQEIEDHEEQMEQIQKFAQGIAHDFGNISQAMQGFVELLKSEIATETGQKIVENLQQAASRALKVSKKISEISRIQVLENTFFDIVEFINSIEDDLKSLTNSKIELVVDLKNTKNGLVFANSSQLQRIIENIIENAVHAISDDGRIVIEAIEYENDLTLKISNNGPAIPRQIADRLFMPFVTTRKEGGTGLGLYLAYEYLNSCGGSIKLQNHSKNVAFELTLPRVARKVNSYDH